MGNRRKNIEKLAARLKELDIEIQELGKLSDNAILEAKAEYRQQIDDLFLKKEALKDKVNSIQNASGNAWEDMKAGKELSWEVFNNAVKKQSGQ